MNTPFKCPVCEGKGQVLGNFYLQQQSLGAYNISPIPCKSCNGTGIIWNNEAKSDLSPIPKDKQPFKVEIEKFTTNKGHNYYFTAKTSKVLNIGDNIVNVKNVVNGTLVFTGAAYRVLSDHNGNSPQTEYKYEVIPIKNSTLNVSESDLFIIQK